MHLKNQTYLARLGFADQDKGYPEHDIACQYLSQIEKAEKLARTSPAVSSVLSFDFIQVDRLLREIRDTLGVESFPNMFPDLELDTGHESFGWTVREVLPSFPLVFQAGSNYRRIVGYYDLKIIFERELLRMEDLKVYLRLGAARHRLSSEVLDETMIRSAMEHKFARTPEIAVEVKARPTSVTDILQQIATYREFDPYSEQVLAACYPISKGKKELLESQAIRVIYLSAESLREFVERRELVRMDEF